MITADKLGNGVTESFGYDANTLALVSQTATAPGGSNGGLVNLNYSYQAASGQLGVGTAAGDAGQLMSTTSSSINGSPESASYTYDLLHRLSTSSQSTNGASAQRRFAYDRWGNRTAEWDSTTGGNQIQTIAIAQSNGVPTNQILSVTGSGNPISYSFDAAGNLTSDGVHTYQYDAENRIKSVDNAATASYAYDYANRRYKKSVGSVLTFYVWEKGSVIAEHNGSTGAQNVDYVFQSGHMIGEGSGSRYTATSTFTYNLGDRLSERVSVDNSGNVVGIQGHLPFGEDLGESGSQEKHHLSTYERDAESGLDNAISRAYASSTGRFVSVDPEASSPDPSNPQTWNRYPYVGNEPLTHIDPSGRDDFRCENCRIWYEFFYAMIFDNLEAGPGGKESGDSSDPTLPGPQCQMSFNTTPGDYARGVYAQGQRYPNVDPSQAIGPAYDAGNSLWYYFYEVNVQPITDTSQAWTPMQWANRTGSLTVQRPDGSTFTFTLPSIGPDAPDNPDPHNVSVDPGDSSYMDWLDTPGLGLGNGNKIIGANVSWLFTYQAVDQNSGRVGCGGALALNWNFKPGADLLKGWTVTSLGTY